MAASSSSSSGRRKRQPRIAEPVVTVHVIERKRGEDPVFDARWDAMWDWLLAPLPGELETRAHEGEEEEEHQHQDHQQQTA